MNEIVTSELENKTCKPCEGGIAPLNMGTVHTLLEKVEHWALATPNKETNTDKVSTTDKVPTTDKKPTTDKEPKTEISHAKEIYRLFKFKNYYETIAFVNAVAWIANQEDHHPDMDVSYNRCLVRYTTHAIGGLSENDFICAAKINALITE